ncbi:PREDICTED: AP-1 complex subunit gamma-like 2 [Thamnophis sirtalis]|uniref:AP-1 complex subunit gamma-like 2 n=1 Tax=Thamnophis sirtalis TaxID=35019 RepID=A0A6I9YZ62_9SAUR|nr:PREDICTED: AP-1 complex subunit gamma-like 2 [Thamnophis sirtalis]
MFRYVALTSLQKLLQTENNAVQRHRTTVLGCLTDPDSTVKRRALQLSLSLINHANIRTTTKELLAFMESSSPDLKSECASGLFLAAENFAPNKRWHIDTILQILIMAGCYIRDDAVPNLIHLIGGAKELHSYAVHQLYAAVSQDIAQQPLVQVATWCLGEYGHFLLDGNCDEVEPQQVDAEDMLSLLERVLQSHLSLPSTRAYALTALMKLGTRLQDVDINRIRSLVSIYCSCHDVELQQRAVEYNTLFRKYDHLRASILEKMPVVEKFGDGKENQETDQNGNEIVTPIVLQGEPSTDPKPQAPKEVFDLLDLLGDPVDTSPALSDPAHVGSGSLLGLLQDLKPSEAVPTRMEVYKKNALLVEFSMSRAPGEAAALLLITATVTNTASEDVEDFSMQVAVPKSFQVQLLAPSGSTVPSHGGPPITQVIRVLNPKQIPLRMRLRISYTLPSGAVVQHVEELNSFPETAWK